MDPAARRTGSGGIVDQTAVAGAAAGKAMAAAGVARGVVVVLAPVAVATAPPAGAVPVAVAAAQPAAGPAPIWTKLRVRWAQVLVVLGLAAVALAFFAIMSSSPTTADYRGLLGSCAPTDAEAAALRAKSKHLLVNAGAQVLAATTALLVPGARKVGDFLNIVGWLTGYRAAGVLLKLFECHGRADAVVVTCYIILEVVALLGYCIGSVIVEKSSY